MQVLWREVFKGNCPLIMDESSTVISPPKLTNPLAFINSQPEGKIIN